MRALKEAEEAEELAEVLLRRRFAQNVWSEAQCRRAGEAAAAAVALVRTEARAGRAASEGAALAQWQWIAMLRRWRFALSVATEVYRS